MTNLFSKNNKTEEYVYAKKYSIKELSVFGKTRIIENEAYIKDFMKQFKKPLIGFFIAFCFLAAGISILTEAEDLIELFKNKKVFFIISIGLIALGLVLALSCFICCKVNKYFEQLKKLDKKDKEVEEFCFKDLCVKEDAIEVDVLAPFVYEINNKKVRKGKSKALNNEKMKVYRENNNILFVSKTNAFSIPVDSIFEISKNKNSRVVNGWNKNKEPSFKDQRKMKVKYNNFLDVTVSLSYAIKVKLEDGEYEIIIPSYDFDKVKELIDNN